MCKFCFNLLEPLYQKHLCDSNSNRANSIILSYDALKRKSTDELNEKETDQVDDSNADDPSPATVVTLRVKNDNSQNNSSSSSMTEEQIKVLSSIFKEEDQQKKGDTDSASTEFNDSDLNDNDQSNVESKSLNLTENDAETEINNTNNSDTNISVDSPHQTEQIFDQKVNLRKKIQFLNMQTESTPVREIQRSRNESAKVLADKFKREIVHFEYGDMCKVACMSNKHDDESDEAEHEEQHSKIWNRYNIVFFSDKTIGICFNQNVIWEF